MQVSQALNNGNKDVCWRRGAAFTAKLADLWEPSGGVSHEDIRHMKNRVWQFNATASLSKAEMREVPKCKESFCKWLVEFSSHFATRAIPMAPLSGHEEPPAGVDGVWR